VPAELIESELFGHEKGSFTGAASKHLGKFEQADRGTLFLDEIGDMPLPMQAKLLRVLEEGEIERVGGEKPTKVDVRVIAATHRNLEQLVREGQFRPDLFHRIFVFPITMPPLRDRHEDIPTLIEHFAAQVSKQNGWKPMRFSPEAVAVLQSYPWPGNVRELRNLVERLMLLATGNEVDSECVRVALPQMQTAGSVPQATATGTGTLGSRVSEFERSTILAELERQKHHITNTARALGLERSYLYKKCQQLGIELRSARQGGGS
jgi:DNA-binding NtrC family response regulator